MLLIYAKDKLWLIISFNALRISYITSTLGYFFFFFVVTLNRKLTRLLGILFSYSKLNEFHVKVVIVLLLLLLLVVVVVVVVVVRLIIILVVVAAAAVVLVIVWLAR